MSSPRLLIPGVGWDTESIVWGYVKFEGGDSLAAAEQSIASYPFDDVYPFTNIFRGGSPARYGAAVIGFAGSYKQVEEDWNEWLWKFADMLSHLAATEAHVCLDCVIGSYRWKLQPQATPQPGVERACEWIVTVAPEDDFSVHAEWLSHFDRRWDRFVGRAEG